MNQVSRIHLRLSRVLPVEQGPLHDNRLHLATLYSGSSAVWLLLSVIAQQDGYRLDLVPIAVLAQPMCRHCWRVSLYEADTRHSGQCTNRKTPRNL